MQGACLNLVWLGEASQALLVMNQSRPRSGPDFDPASQQNLYRPNMYSNFQVHPPGTETTIRPSWPIHLRTLAVIWYSAATDLEAYAFAAR